MRAITVSKADLKLTLLENRETHIADYEIAWEKYQIKLVEKISFLHKQALNLKEGEKIDTYVRLERPEDHRDDYDRAIKMLDWEQEDTVKLDEDEFRQLVQDDWDWSYGVKMSNRALTGYSSPSKTEI